VPFPLDQLAASRGGRASRSLLSFRRPCPKGKVRRSRSHPLRVVVEQVVGPDIQCGCKGFQVGVHENLRFDVGLATRILGTLPAPPSTPRQLYSLEFVI
jgi:hypothetical protein